MEDIKNPITNVKIGYKDYIIEQPETIPSIRTEYNGNINGECMGTHRYYDSKIIIASKFEQNDKNQTFLHELLHGICSRFGLTELNDNDHAIDLLALGMYEIIRDNPHIFKMADI